MKRSEDFVKLYAKNNDFFSSKIQPSKKYKKRTKKRTTKLHNCKEKRTCLLAMARETHCPLEFYEERCTPPTNPMTLYECISVLVRWFYINTPLFDYGGASYDVICNRLNHNNVTIDECKLYINSIVY